MKNAIEIITFKMEVIYVNKELISKKIVMNILLIKINVLNVKQGIS